MTISTWTPVLNQVSNITNANPGVVTTTTNHGYLNGLYVRFQIPPDYGMNQLGSNIYLIEILSPTTFSINVDTTNYTPFASGSIIQVPQVIPVAEVALTLQNAERNTLTPIGGGL